MLPFVPNSNRHVHYFLIPLGANDPHNLYRWGRIITGDCIEWWSHIGWKSTPTTYPGRGHHDRINTSAIQGCDQRPFVYAFKHIREVLFSLPHHSLLVPRLFFDAASRGWNGNPYQYRLSLMAGKCCPLGQHFATRSVFYRSFRSQTDQYDLT